MPVAGAAAAGGASAAAAAAPAFTLPPLVSRALLLAKFAIARTPKAEAARINSLTRL